MEEVQPSVVQPASEWQAFKKARVSEYHVPSVQPINLQDELEKSIEQRLGAVPGKALTLHEIQQDKLTQVAAINWSSAASSANGGLPPFEPQLVIDIYRNELRVPPNSSKSVNLQRVMVLEISQYLEKYLWPNFDPSTASFEHIMSIVLMVNEKFRENVPAWTCFSENSKEDALASFFQRLFNLKEQGGVEMSVQEKINYVLFMIHCFQSLENEIIRKRMLLLVGLHLWHVLTPGRLKRELYLHPQLMPSWQRLLKKEARAQKNAASKQNGLPHIPAKQKTEAKFIPSLLSEFLQILEGAVDSSSSSSSSSTPSTQKDGVDSFESAKILYCERFTEFLIDLLSQLPTRRFVKSVVEEMAIVIKCKQSNLYAHSHGRLFRQLIDLLQFYEGFEIDDHNGKQLSDEEVWVRHSNRLQALQRLLFKQMPKLRELSLANLGSVEKRAELKKRLAVLSNEELKDLIINKLQLISPDDPWIHRPSFLMEVILSAFERRQSQRAALNMLPLYPNEEVMWDESLVPSINYTGEGCLALPKLNLQFLTLHDYLLRNFNLFRLESTYEVREDVQDVLQRLGARVGMEGETVFKGWARMAMPMSNFKITQIKTPHIGEIKPSSVIAEIQLNIGIYSGAMRAEWDDVKQHDVLFLLGIQAPLELLSQEASKKVSVFERYGLQFVRGCEVLEIRDEAGVLMNDFTGRVKREDWKPPAGDGRTILVELDAAQYQIDLQYRISNGLDDPYQMLNVVMRRKPKENNFKAILESIRDLMNEDATVPPWLHDLFLGYGNPAAAHWHNMQEHFLTIDFKDTFLDKQHLLESFPDYQVKFALGEGEEGKEEEIKPPFRITLPPPSLPEPTSKKGVDKGEETLEKKKSVIVVEPYNPPDPGPYPQLRPKQNSVRFTPTQVEAIVAGLQPGLTMVVGPPGTGKTDTAVQIMHVLYHTCPEQRTLLITHSNQALNDLFEKIMERDVPARYLLRLGMGEQELDTKEEFSRQGRVNSMLIRRLELLQEVEKMASSLHLSTDVAYTCETSAHFWLLHVLSRWEEFIAACEANKDNPSIVRDRFPFKVYFQDAPDAVMQGLSFAHDMRVAEGCFRHLAVMFQELEECRAFELLKTTADRSNYLMTKQAKIVAMTCTHAALKRRDFLSLGFKYDNLVMEESAQILEIETFIPMLLQKPEDGLARLKRCILIGDHQQLPPVVKNMAFQKYSHMDQSLFTRFVRLGVPYTQLNMQGRCRPSISSLFNWRYKQLGNLPNVVNGHAFRCANAGFAHDYQLIDVGDFDGRGESEPNPWFYQNLGEAEYVVSVFQYMRLLGFSANKISIITTYNGQKHLIRDVIEQRCAQNPLFGRPSKVTTVDRFQGQQNDYILLSLVRTKTVGHLRDVRRLVVAMSRARLGLYVFCRKSLFEECYELQPTFQLLLQRPDQLGLVLNESSHPTDRLLSQPCVPHLVSDVMEMASIVTSKWNQLHHAQQEEEYRKESASGILNSMLAHARSKGYGVSNSNDGVDDNNVENAKSDAPSKDESVKKMDDPSDDENIKTMDDPSNDENVKIDESKSSNANNESEKEVEMEEDDKDMNVDS